MKPHYAVVVGIDRYVGYPTLHSAARDAEGFATWLKGRGGLDPSRVKVLKSPEGDGPLDEDTALPLAQQVFNAIEKWRKQVRSEVEAGDAEYADTRLYVFVSGHGLAVTPDDACLLPADATPERTGNVSLRRIQNFLRESQEFHELVLLADCCRDRVPGAPEQDPPWTEARFPGEVPVRSLFWRATGFAQKAFEAEPDGDPTAVHGYFTQVLLEALNDPDPPGGVLDGLTVAERLVREVPRRLPASLKVKQEPEVPVDARESLVFWRGAAPVPEAAADSELDARAASGVSIAVHAAGQLRAMGATRLVTLLPAGDYDVVFGQEPGARHVAVHLSGPAMVADPQRGLEAIAPVIDHSGANETHAAAFERLLAGPAGVIVAVRWKRHDAGGAPPTLDGIAIGGHGPHAWAPLGETETVSDAGQVRFVGGAVRAGPGATFVDVGGARLPVTLHPGWSACLFAPPDTVGRACLAGASLHLLRPGAQPPADGLLASSYALDGLLRGVVAVPQAELLTLLFDKWDEPFGAVIAAHLLLLTPSPDWALLGQALTNLAGLLPGDPDVAGLVGLALRRAPPGEHLRFPAPGAIAHLPSLWRSWEGLTWLDATAGVFPEGAPVVAQGPHATPVGPWLTVPRPGGLSFSYTPDTVTSAEQRIREWAAAAKTDDAGRVAMATRLPMATVRRVLAEGVAGKPAGDGS